MSAPDLRPNQPPQEYAQPRQLRVAAVPRLTRRQAQDVLALLLVIFGAAGLGLTAFAWDWRAGAALVSLAVLGGGYRLGLDR